MTAPARPDSPGPDVSETIVFIGDAMLRANNATTNPSQPKMAFFLCCALHRAIRAAGFLVGCELFISVLSAGMYERSRDLDLADARRGRACGDVQRQELECFVRGERLHRPPDRVTSGVAGGQRRSAAERALVSLERGVDDAALVGLVEVLQEETRHAASLPQPRPRHHGDAP